MAEGSSDSNAWARSKARANVLERKPYKWYFVIQVTCKMNVKGQTWNKNIRTLTRSNEKSPSEQPVGGGTNIQSKQAYVLQNKS